jgi:hypothetical protein
MSGGYYDYKQYAISRIADDIENVIITNDSTELNRWGEPVGREFSEETIAQMRNAVGVLRRAFIYAQRIDWLLSGDDGEESFHRRLVDELTSLSIDD